MKLLTRDQFREGVFKRDGHQCVVVMFGGKRCPEPAVDAHHIMERRLWTDGGYYLENGASLCAEHHLLAEKTYISCEGLRDWIGIRELALPEHLYKDQLYDKWGNPILPNGMRMRGELFEDESVQKVLEPMLYMFTNKVKYPRTYHLPCSPGVTKDDRVIKDLSTFVGVPVLVTVKMDGENTTMYRDGIHARSLEYDPHPSRDWVKALHARIAHEIPENWRICGENLYAKHSIHYKNLKSYFQVFSIWDGLRCLSWEETCDYADMLGLETVPRIGEYMFDNPKQVDVECRALGGMLKDGFGKDGCEGFVIRHADEFTYANFRKSAAKYVRADHVQTHGHWMRSILIPNEVKDAS